MNRLNVSLFTPALLFSKVAFFLTPGVFWDLHLIAFLANCSFRKTQGVMGHSYLVHYRYRDFHGGG
jgi:hypothetical protein